MKYNAKILHLKNDPSLIKQYIEHHKNVWPDVLKAHSESGVQNMKIFIRGTTLFMYTTVKDDYDPQKADEIYTKYSITQKWEDLMHTFQEQLPNSNDNEWWSPMKEIFNLGEQSNLIKTRKDNDEIIKYNAKILHLKNDSSLIGKYIEHHKNVWPDVLKALSESGSEDMKIFIQGTTLCMYSTVKDDYDPQKADEIYNKYPITLKWEDLMQTFQEQLPDSDNNEWWCSMKEIFNFKEQFR